MSMSSREELGNNSSANHEGQAASDREEHDAAIFSKILDEINGIHQNSTHPTKNAAGICDMMGQMLSIPGFVFGVLVAARMKKEDVVSMPWIGSTFAEGDGLFNFFRGMVPFVLYGTFSAMGSNFMLVVDGIINGIRTMPKNGSKEDWKKWLKSIDPKMVVHILSALFGIGIYFTLLYKEIKNPLQHFAGPFHLESLSHQIIVDILAFVGIPAFIGQIFAYAASALHNQYLLAKHFVRGFKSTFWGEKNNAGTNHSPDVDDSRDRNTREMVNDENPGQNTVGSLSEEGVVPMPSFINI